MTITTIREYEKNHDYAQIEAIGRSAVEKMDCSRVIRSQIALKAAQAADYLGHAEEMMRFCWEAFRSDSTDRNLLRLFGTKEMAEKYGLNGKEVLRSCKRGNVGSFVKDAEQ